MEEKNLCSLAIELDLKEKLKRLEGLWQHISKQVSIRGLEGREVTFAGNLTGARAIMGS